MEHLTAWLNAKRGRGTELATALNITPGAISQWKHVPAERVLEVSRITGISVHDLRPEVFGTAPEQAA